MKPEKSNKPTIPKLSRKLTEEEKELKEIHRKYHPQETIILLK